MASVINFLLFSIFAYLLGSIPFSFIISKSKGIDIRKIGSKATTAGNLARALGWKWGIIVEVLDFLKGALPAWLAFDYLIEIWQIIIISLLPSFGDIFPIWLKFKGGKGAAPFFGAAMVLTGPKFFFSVFIIWILILIFSQTMSLTSFSFSWILAILISIFYPNYLIFGLLGIALITFAMRENIERMRQGKETKISLKW